MFLQLDKHEESCTEMINKVKRLDSLHRLACLNFWMLVYNTKNK